MKDPPAEKNFSLLKHQKSILTTNLKIYNYDIKNRIKKLFRKWGYP